MLNWKVISEQYQTDTSFVLVTVAKVQGSSPRETGAKMLVNKHKTLGTIGGGNLEFFAIQQAKEILNCSEDNSMTEHKTPLIPQYDQCCGGLVQLIFEKVNPKTSHWLHELHNLVSKNQQAWLITNIKEKQRFIQTSLETEPTNSPQNTPWLTKQSILIEPVHNTALPIIIFGTGHVGKALINQLQHLNVHITAVDSRAEQLPKTSGNNIMSIHTENWQNIVTKAPNNAYFLVLTHSHKLDYQITEEILQKEHFDYCGLIGSKTKKIRFERQLLSTGISQLQLNKMTCPIGLPSIQGKTPEIIAASVVAQILEISTQQQTQSQPFSTTNQLPRTHHV